MGLVLRLDDVVHPNDLGPVLTMPTVNCGMIRRHRCRRQSVVYDDRHAEVHDNLGNVSAVTTDSGVRLIPDGSCGF